MSQLAQTRFEEAVSRLDPRLRRLLGDIGVHSFPELKVLDPWALVHRAGVGRSVIRELVAFMRQQGIEVSSTPPLVPQLARQEALVISVPRALAEAVRERATREGVSPASWVLSLISDALE